MYINQNLKIQVRSGALPWADLENVPALQSHAQGRAWMAANGLEALEQKHGLEFRIVPMNTPAAATAVLERNESHGSH